jgi:hypothetical protein
MSLCASCGAENRPEASFCSSCGSPSSGSARTAVRSRHLGVAQLEHAEWLLGQERPDEAQPLLDEARETFQRLEARPWLERADAAVAAPQASVPA